jgi:hypothetical protein
MSKSKGVLIGLAVLLGAGAMNGGVVRNPDGTINPGETLSRSTDIGGAQAGKALDRGAESVGRGAGSALSSSNVAKAGAVGAAAYGAAKLGKTAKDRYSICWKRKSCDGTPIVEPVTVDDSELLADDDLLIDQLPLVVGG